MKIPSKIKVEGYIWSFVRKWRITFNGAEAYGLTIPQTRTIELLHGLTKEELEYTAIHEVVHAVLAEKGMYIAGMSQEMEEMVCHAIAKEFPKIFTMKFKTQSNK